MKIVWNNRFKRAFKKLIKRNPELQNRITNVLILLGGSIAALVVKSDIVPTNRIHYLNQETEELIAVTTTIILKTKQNNGANRTI
jgi:mRNA-degrading endonuclease YafQ of YafQ-DinJ toxin-antitoxin module